jgi:hypothetical protein
MHPVLFQEPGVCFLDILTEIRQRGSFANSPITYFANALSIQPDPIAHCKLNIAN